MERRTFLTAAAATGLAGLAGCVAGASPRPPEVPQDRLEAGGWTLVDERTETVFDETIAGQDVQATASTEVYADEQLAAELSEKTLGQVEGRLAPFFASRITFDPDVTNLPGGVGREELIDRVEAESRDTLRSQMGDAGVEDIDLTAEGTLAVDTGEEARRTDLAGAYAFGPIEFPVTEETTIQLEGDDLAVNGHLAVWHHEDSVLVAGGAYPAENYAETIEEELSPAVEVSVDVDLELEPESYRESLFALVTGVE